MNGILNSPPHCPAREILDHIFVTIALHIYSHVLPGMGGEAADAMGEALG